MICKSIFVSLLLLIPSTTVAFRAPENPTGLKNLKVPPTIKKSAKPAAPTTELKNVITPETMEQVSKTIGSKTISRELTLKKRWEIGVDNAATDYEDEYWFNPTIHNFGNIGFLGTIHAVLAPVSTKVIDILAYDGENIRDRVSTVWSYHVLYLQRCIASVIGCDSFVPPFACVQNPLTDFLPPAGCSQALKARHTPSLEGGKKSTNPRHVLRCRHLYPCIARRLPRLRVCCRCGHFFRND